MNLEIIELEITEESPVAGCSIKELSLPDGALVISILRDGSGFVPVAESTIEAGDEVLLVLDAVLEDEITERFAPRAGTRAA